MVDLQFVEDQVQLSVHAHEHRSENQEVLATRVFAKVGLTPRSVVGLVIVPGRAQSPVDFGDRYALVGLDDLKDRIAESASPHELWRAIKAHEVRRSVDVVASPFMVGEWTVESDGVSRSQLVAAAPTGVATTSALSRRASSD